MIVFYALTAILIAYAWVDYFRHIDLFEKEKFGHYILVFGLGGLSVFIVFAFQYLVLYPSGFELNGSFVNDFLYCVFAIGLVEEITKLIPFLIFYRLFRSSVNEPIDYLIFVSVSALGFAAIENVLYFLRHGPDIISGRSVLAVVTHMFCSALMAYGIIRNLYFYDGKRPFIVLWYILLAAASHGFYDFWLIYDTGNWGWIVTFIYFLLTISMFVTILNNALNQSGYFTYHKVIDTGKVSGRLFLFYAGIFIVQFSLLAWETSLINAWVNAIYSVYLTGAIVVVCVLRLSRIKLIKGRWFPLRPELPFGFTDYEGTYRLMIKGESYNEIKINSFLGEHCTLSPLNSKDSFLEESRLILVEEKIFLKNDVTYYRITVFLGEDAENRLQFFIKPKTSGTILTRNNYPMVALLDYRHLEKIDSSLEFADFEFKEWAYLHPVVHVR